VPKKDILKLPSLWLERWKHLDPFWHVFLLEGEVFREQKGRKTLRFIEDNESYFVKMHRGTTLHEIFKNLLQGRLPIMGAKNELEAITQLESFGFVPDIVGYGFRKNLSFIITKELTYTISLEDFCKDFKTNPPSLKLKWALIRKIAEIAKTIHTAGINHRDFYLCHFLLDLTGGRELLDPNSLNLFVIDWHRAQTRKKVPLRWRIKDIAGLYFSAMEFGLTQRDLLRFIKSYNSNQNKTFWKSVQKRAKALYLKERRKLYVCK
jgi:heptose I phosphotransferase